MEIVLYRELGPIRFLLQRLDVTMKEEAMVGSVQPTDVEPSGGCCCGVVLNLDLKICATTNRLACYMINESSKNGFPTFFLLVSRVFVTSVFSSHFVTTRVTTSDANAVLK